MKTLPDPMEYLTLNTSCFSSKKLFLAIFILIAICFTAKSQSLENIKTSFDGERITITYDLTNSDPDQKFKVIVYSSHNGYSTPIVSISGDWGNEVASGKTKKVTWDVKKELPADFDNDITIKVRATKILLKLTAKSLAKKAYKKGQSVDIQWQGGKPTDKISIQLLQNGVMKQKLADNLSNGQSYQWSVPKDLKGKGYSLLVSNSSDQSNTSSFNVKPKIPLLLIIAPVVVVGGAIAFLGGGDPPVDPVIPATELPGPTKP